MKTLIASIMIGAGIMISATCNAQAPAGSTGECKDGTYTSAESKRGACAGHGGVKDWYSSKAPAKEAAAPKETAPTKAAAPTAVVAPSAKTAASSSTTAAAGGGAGQVWVNSKSKVYHCQGDKWYGKTKEGQYMTEAAAKAAGNHPDHGKACS
jgi:hypothetical protein